MKKKIVFGMLVSISAVFQTAQSLEWQPWDVVMLVAGESMGIAIESSVIDK